MKITSSEKAQKITTALIITYSIMIILSLISYIMHLCLFFELEEHSFLFFLAFLGFLAIAYICASGIQKYTLNINQDE